jgi:hypothetical protein
LFFFFFFTTTSELFTTSVWLSRFKGRKSIVEFKWKSNMGLGEGADDGVVDGLETGADDGEVDGLETGAVDGRNDSVNVGLGVGTREFSSTTAGNGDKVGVKEGIDVEFLVGNGANREGIELDRI